MEVAGKGQVPAARGRRVFNREYLIFLAFIAPNFLLFIIFTYWPLVYQGYLSLVHWDMISPVKRFVGLENYAYLFSDPDFHRVMFNTLYFTVAVLVGSLALGLALALLLNQRLRGRNFARTVVFAPVILSGAAVGLVWAYIFDPNYGLMRTILGWFGLPPIDWLGSPAWAMPAVIIVYLWKNLGYSAMIYLAGLQNIPAELYEAARVDGAGRWQQFLHVTLPQLSPVTFFLIVTTIISSVQAFDIISVMTDGGPVGATTTLIWYMYEQGFRAFRAGIAAASGMLMFIILLVVTLVQVGWLQRKVYYE